ncbi:MAG: phosphodiester glycosidase family protein [Syntrophomonadaceae bacterium]|nr:phosphodiester glycosidase family protein [Syntrophomonadaceae bacterium]
MNKLLTVIMRFTIISALLFVSTSPFIVLYGPFKNVRNTVIGAVGTSAHSYWLRYIMSDEKWSQLVADAQGSDNFAHSDIISSFTNSHSSDIKLTDISSPRFQGYLMEISDPTRVKIGVAKNLGESGQTTSEIAKANGAIAAVNGGGFNDANGTGNGSSPFGVLFHNGTMLNETDFTAPVPLIGFNQDGVLFVGKYTTKQMKDMQIMEGVSFYPPLILNGKKQITSGDGGWGIAPRTAIGQKADGHILLLVIDGRQPPMLGATLVDVQNILYENGAVTAANLDGGSSTTMYFQGKIVNSPCDLLGERCIPTAILVI